MRKSKREITEFSDILELISRCDTIRIGINDESGAPYVVPMSFGFESIDGRVIFYLHGANEGYKHDLIAKDDRVCVEGDICHEFCENGSGGITCEYESFIARGIIEEIVGDEAVHALGMICIHCNYPGFPCDDRLFKVMKVYKITAASITGKKRGLSH